ncbi:MAG: hypothetical protein PF439_03800 [Helicobacteraceae bacterium]|jgi:hypothetical protein|nr:hypothetical protein [Helicobacteraceae bacterium]
MAQRNILDEIIEKRNRTVTKNRFDSFKNRLDSIDDSYKFLMSTTTPDATRCNEELSRYYPIALVAMTEGYFRTVISDLINKGSPFIERATQLSNVKLNVETASAIQLQKITIGEYVAHFLRISSLDDINRAMSHLLNLDFLDHLVDSEFDIFDDGSLTLREDRANFIQAVKDLFSMRHMLCHEFSENISIDNGGYFRFVLSCEYLICLSEVVINFHEQENVSTNT